MKKQGAALFVKLSATSSASTVGQLLTTLDNYIGVQ